MQLTIELTLNEDSELIHKAAAADDGRVVVKRLYLWLPRLVPKDSMYSNFVSEFLKPTTWTYMRDLYNQSANTRAVQNMFQISPATDNVNTFSFISSAQMHRMMMKQRGVHICLTLSN